jgi:broad specificity polyphosphatase/5'/3'-nucleotidase SurE
MRRSRAVWGLGDVLVAAPTRQWSGASRCFARETTGVIRPRALQVGGESVPAFAVDGSPAQVVLHALLELAPPGLRTCWWWGSTTGRTPAPT